MKVHVWVPDYVSATGGIQGLSRFLVRALRECLPDAEIVVLSKNDRSVPDPGENTVTQFSAVGWWAPSQRTAAFTINLLRWAVRERPDLIVATHVNFTPAAHWLKKLWKIPFIAIGHGVEVWQTQSVQVRRALRSADHFLLKRYQLRLDQPVILTVARLARTEQYKGYDQVLR